MKSDNLILIVDDDKDLSMLIQDMLEDQGYNVALCESLDEAYLFMEKQMPKLILLDINLPDGTGFELCKELRETSQVPIIFASARTSEDDKVTGLDMGGDDYLSKPYSLKELSSRINSLLRRTYGAVNEAAMELVLSGNRKLSINRKARLATLDGKTVTLSPKEYDLLLYLIERKGQALSKDELFNNVWGLYSDVEPSTLTVHVRWLREKFEVDPSKPVHIKTVWSVGYMFEA